MGSISTALLAKSAPLTLPLFCLSVSISGVLVTGIPSTTYKGVLSPENERAPRIVICEDAPGIPDDGLISTPDTFPCKAPARFELEAWVSLSDLISCTAYPNAFFSREIPIAVTTTSSKISVSECKTIFTIGFTATSCDFIPINETTKVPAEL